MQQTQNTLLAFGGAFFNHITATAAAGKISTPKYHRYYKRRGVRCLEPIVAICQTMWNATILFESKSIKITRK